MAELMEYKCPCCGGAVEFNSGIQKMKCPYCETEFDMEALKEYEEEQKAKQESDMTWENPADSVWGEQELNGMQVYVCESCGGEIVADANTAATKCPYCGNNVVVKGKFEGDLKPDYVIPFKLDKKAAKEALKRHTQGKRLIPKLFRDENHLDEIKGIYVPFWLYDADVNGRMQYKAVRTRMWSDANYNYREEQYFSVVRGGSVGFSHVPVDGSSQMPDDLMESIEPFDVSGLVPFESAYMAGYLADRYDVTSEESAKRANDRIKTTTEDILRNSVDGGYASVNLEHSNLKLKNSQESYALYPVWLLNTSWQGQNYLFAMNGQTGKFVGDLPLDKSLYWKWHAIWTLGLGAIVYLLMFLFLR